MRPQEDPKENPLPPPETVAVTDQDAIRLVRMNRPDKKNALTQPMYAALATALRDADANAALRCTVIAGVPGAFCAGNDLHDFQAQAKTGLAPSTMDFLHALARQKKPLVAAVDGIAVGIGTTLLLHCDHVVASSGSTFATPFARLGLVPEAASSLLAPLRMGHARAFALLVMGRPMTADDAKAAGLVNSVVESAAVEDTAFKAAREIANLPPGSVALARRLMRGDPDTVAERIDAEAALFKERLATDEAQTAIASFFTRKK